MVGKLVWFAGFAITTHLRQLTANDGAEKFVILNSETHALHAEGAQRASALTIMGVKNQTKFHQSRDVT